MSEQPKYRGDDLVLVEVLKRNDSVPGVADLFQDLKADENGDQGIRDILLKKSGQLEAAEQLVAAGLAHWETKEHPATHEKISILFLTKN